MKEKSPGSTCLYISDVSVYLSRKKGGGTGMSLRFFSGSVCKFTSWKQKYSQSEKVLLLVENEENAWVKLIFFNEAPPFLLTTELNVDVRDIFQYCM